MITEEDKKRIKSEEIFRAEIKESLKKSEDKSIGKRSWKLVNSPFGLWLLSTVVVGLIVYFYNDNKLKAEISANNAATLQRLNTETAHRLQKFRLALVQQDPAKLYYQDADLAYMIDGTLVDDGSPSPQKPIFIFPEFKDRTMNSLLYEMERLKDDKKKALSIKAARGILKDIKEELLDMDKPPRRNFSISQRISQIIQSQPENLSTRDSILWLEYQEKEKHFQEKELKEYHARIQTKLDDLTVKLLENTFLKAISQE